LNVGSHIIFFKITDYGVAVIECYTNQWILKGIFDAFQHETPDNKKSKVRAILRWTLSIRARAKGDLARLLTPDLI
jgi:hypothetical protein